MSESKGNKIAIAILATATELAKDIGLDIKKNPNKFALFYLALEYDRQMWDTMMKLIYTFNFFTNDALTIKVLLDNGECFKNYQTSYDKLTKNYKGTNVALRNNCTATNYKQFVGYLKKYNDNTKQGQDNWNGMKNILHSLKVSNTFADLLL